MGFWSWLIDMLNYRRRLPPPAPPPPQPAPRSQVDAVVAEINRLRAERGLLPVVSDPRVDTVSQAWAVSLASRDVLDHGNVAYRIASVYPNVPYGEDVAAGNLGVQDVVAMWIADRPHAQILFGNFNRVGVGIALSRGGWSYWVADFVFVVPKATKTRG